ncbi:hypothetical protein QU661_01045 [Mogibacterium neglectum]|jgi:hypothetical protein|uniref:hypothetical protein n=1 Tax=Mogibacterium neglectum TaxID=114528 RepID=UPI00272BEE16|nr:hypothetical protein [Mogibacterium neglectum]WLD76459.1 hypothetical protein QU661_01045 [Mogibacterium neglectum]
MEHVKKRRILFVAILVLSMVLVGISTVSAASRTQDVYLPYDVTVKSGSSAYGFTDGDRWSAVYEKIMGTNGTTKQTIWHSEDGSSYYTVEASRALTGMHTYIYTFKANGKVIYQGENGKMDAAIIAKLYDRKLIKTIYSGTETVKDKTFDGPVEVEQGANITFENCKFNYDLTTYGVSNVSNSTFTDSTAINKGKGITYITDTYFGHLASSSSFYGKTSSIVGVKIKSNRLADATKGMAYTESLNFPDFSYTYYPGSFSPKVTKKMHYDSINVVGNLPTGLVAGSASYDAAAENTVVKISGTPSMGGRDQKFNVNFKEGVSKLDITIPMLINVNAYSVEYKVLGDSPAGFTAPSTVTGIGHGEVVNLNAAPGKIVGKKNGVHGVWEFTGWSTDKDNLEASKTTSLNVMKNTTVYGKWKFTSDKKPSITKPGNKRGPKTGDSNNIGGYLLVLGATSVILAVVAKRRGSWKE